MDQFKKIIQVAFTYMGTIVGAGFATGQEILTFFTQFGSIATLTIFISSIMFIWLGTKIMIFAHDIGAKSYEDLNKLLFGERLGEWISFFILVVLFAITSVMLAGGGSIFHEHFHLSYQIGLWFTILLAYLVLLKGINAILIVNSIVVPLILLFTVILIFTTIQSPNAGNWLHRTAEPNPLRVWLSPFLYIGFNLSLAQAVLVPIGSQIKDKKIVYWGGIVGGLGIGLMLLAGHFALSAQMPGITQFEIPMGMLIVDLGKAIQFLFLLVIYAEIFTTFIANIYGLTLQIKQRTSLHHQKIMIAILIIGYFISQIGFSTLLSTLYPLFGFLSLGWLWMIMKTKPQV
ncbi:YkvI family membrane protein [Chengkuizengella axinellae]|uniref:Membrane protein YkvI n=1 Tax=Chengkuizengella axinellae TaxID=3064388 RepID=A0ABT9IZ37_9BACL|nr:hypothetical protein [Chengkuizengella sp. 2205SS18-9]MDP5274578.1 hypothetical protein [Chengkuizengella sp. 2205SS18-9]